MSGPSATLPPTRYESMRRKRQATIAELWAWHATVCDCRSADGGRCDNARTISDLDVAMRKLESRMVT